MYHSRYPTQVSGYIAASPICDRLEYKFATSTHRCCPNCCSGLRTHLKPVSTTPRRAHTPKVSCIYTIRRGHLLLSELDPAERVQKLIRNEFPFHHG
ncbi:hypothetical protein BD289DRAFT_70478 [Coniella lustricola]|uniref:Uncharacterized protein n=1 Tax=Coniella lustricola TaxID=2025994 RepID=A0A2T2ZZX4_9PEZI|nr:hypothetical protein BD289DRAFT_70478 [Coniella lustricola]